MPRPRKWRNVCCLPMNNLYGPLNRRMMNDEIILMTVDEYETIRLIDFEGLMQEECAEKMNVARTTVQRMYNNARKKISISLVKGSLLKIEGGEYKLCDNNQTRTRCHNCFRNIDINQQELIKE